MARLLGMVLLVTGCATVPARPIAQESQRTAEQIAADRAVCEASARHAEDSRVLRAPPSAQASSPAAS
ncbi:MAG: hypothetical protein HYY95_25145 [Candidatus Rokubacteria bacterium]|nr:hypothetical protein [Candidatus Rokubacteria bacterium]